MIHCSDTSHGRITVSEFEPRSPFERKVTEDQVIAAWQSVNPDKRITEKLAETGQLLGISPLTVRRYVTRAGLIGGPAVVQEAGKAAARLMQVLMPSTSSQTERAGAVLLADTIQRQRDSVAGLLDTESRLSSMLRELTGGCIDEHGNPMPTDEGVLHRAVASYAKLVDAIAKRTELERKVWGIRDDAGSSFAQTLEELAAPPPVGHPPVQISGTSESGPSRLPSLEEDRPMEGDDVL